VIRIHCAAILFDLDGVLVDSTPAVERVWSRWALERGFNPEEVIRKAHGRPSMTTIREYLPGSDYEAENHVIEQGEIDDLEGVVPLPGTRELLAALPPKRWTIVTSCTRRLAEVRIRAAGFPIPLQLVTSSDIVRGKPDPEPYLKGAEKLGVPAEKCLVLEDAPAGIRSGKSAGARVVAFRTTSPEPELLAAGADWILESCRAISFVTESENRLVLDLDAETADLNASGTEREAHSH
jgi:mannitol-1-/sugar-/sorbitol-6-phosphatase